MADTEPNVMATVAAAPATAANIDNDIYPVVVQALDGFWQPFSSGQHDPYITDIEELCRRGETAVLFIQSVPTAYRNVQPDGDNLNDQQAAVFAKALLDVLELESSPMWNTEMGISLHLCRSLRDYLIWLWALVPLKVLWAQIDAWCWGDVNTADVVVPVWWLGNGILQVLAMGCTPESRMAIGPLLIDHLRKAHPRWHEECGAVVTSSDQLKNITVESEYKHIMLSEPIIGCQQHSAVVKALPELYQRYKPFGSHQENDGLELLMMYEHAWSFRLFVRDTWRYLSINKKLEADQIVAELVIIIEEVLGLDPDNSDEMAFWFDLHSCTTLDDIEVFLWNLVSPAEIMAKYWYWCHPLELPDDVLAKLSPQPLYEDSVNMPFWNQCHGYLLRVAKANTLQQAQAEGEIAIPLLKKLDPNWTTPRGPELLVHDVCQMFPTVELSANNFRQAKMMHLLKQPPPMWGELYDTMTR